MIERQYGRIIFVCDACGDSYEAGECDFQKAVAEVKEEGWLITKDGNQWLHWCCQPCEPYAPQNNPGGCQRHPNATHEPGFGLAGGGYGAYSVCNECGAIFDKVQESGA